MASKTFWTCSESSPSSRCSTAITQSFRVRAYENAAVSIAARATDLRR